MKVSLVFFIAALSSFVAADILFIRSLFSRYHPVIGYWVWHLPIQYVNLLFLITLYHLGGGSAAGGEFHWYNRRAPIVGPHVKALVEICTISATIFLSQAFNKHDALDRCLIGSVACLLVYSIVVSHYYLPKLDVGLSLSACLTSLLMSMIWDFSGLTFHSKSPAFVALFSIIVIRIYVEYFSFKCTNDPPQVTGRESDVGSTVSSDP